MPKEAHTASTGQSKAFPANDRNSSSETILLPNSSPVGAGLGDTALYNTPSEESPTTKNGMPSSTTMGGSPAKNLDPGLNESSLSTPEDTPEQQTNRDVWKQGPSLLNVLSEKHRPGDDDGKRSDDFAKSVPTFGAGFEVNLFPPAEP
jgi:hypothetical protein